MASDVRRTRLARGSLTPELILGAAETIAAADGLEALSMRGLAGSLDATPMALYNHFTTKDQIIGGLLDRVERRFAPELPTEDWVADLGRFARAHRALLAAHQWAVPALATREGGRIADHAVAIAVRGGFPRGPAAAVARGILALNLGWRTGGEGDYQLVLGALLRGLRG